MRSISILTLAALTLAACETTPTQTEIGQVEEIEQSESTDTVGEIVEDTQEDETDVVESEEIECEFEVLTAEAVQEGTPYDYTGLDIPLLPGDRLYFYATADISSETEYATIEVWYTEPTDRPHHK